MTDPLSPASGVASRLLLATLFSVLVWAGVVWAVLT
jgi:hypothetical protein